ncbi:hypothetical protein NHH03_03210 [Stieleria sp. TO1_6]|uniref:hypothetical protein n=1 Tax=Stieleria tagensis TaxID=2956795 RepID=UPI00209B6083|nr:hypothetical protein [Stieleria tagensis]MCO8120732.1 hypothetical protein [Stieleria tagensis]
MIEPAMIALIRDGETTLFRDPCGSALFARNLVWGPNALEKWLRQRNPVDEFDTACDAGVVVDYDANALLWYSTYGITNHPKSIQLLDQLIQQAWPDFEIIYATDGLSDLEIAAGQSINQPADGVLRIHADGVDALSDRPDDLDEEADVAEQFDPDADDDGPVAWVTLLDEENVVHHRLLSELTLDLITNERAPLERLMGLPSTEIPAECSVIEGIWIDQSQHTLHLWGGRQISAVASAMTSAWGDWKVQLVPLDGYQQQCQFSGPAGKPFPVNQALGSVVPALLSNARIDPQLLLGEIGQSFKGVVVRIVRALTILFCLPFAIFALVSGNWKTGAITIGIIVAVVVIVFKWVEAKWRRGFAARMAAVTAAQTTDDDATAESVAGPSDPQTRRTEVDAMLRRAGLPSVAEVQPHFEYVVPDA